jgi:hypothetical protein
LNPMGLLERVIIPSHHNIATLFVDDVIQITNLF